MKMLCGSRLALRLGVVAVVACLCVDRAEAQDPKLKPTFGEVKLKAGFLPDPFTKDLVAGGPIETKLGGVRAKVAKAPDFKLYYEAANFALTIRAESNADTTLLINLPDGTWVADDDSGGNFNPKLTFAQPQSGRYDIWVGTYHNGLPKAKLIITERESVVAPGKPEADKVHLVLLIAGADSNIGSADVKDVASVRKALVAAFAKDKERLAVHDLTPKNPKTGKYYTGDEVINSLKSTNIGKNDTVFVYHSGHGGIDDPKNPEGTHVLTIDGGTVRRKAIIDTVKLKQPRLLLILTDCCSTFTSLPLEAAIEGGKPGANKLNIQTVRDLMLKGVGIASITAADDGKSGIASFYGSNPGEAGSAFTVAMMRLWYRQDKSYTTWGQMFPDLREETGKASGGAHYARAFQLPNR
jgi:hypothetical protein